MQQTSAVVVKFTLEPSNTTRMIPKRIVWFLFLLLVLASCKQDDSDPTGMNPPPDATEILVSDELRLNPTGYAPLSASILLETSEPVRVRMRVVGRSGTTSDLVRDFPQIATDHNIPVHGLYGGFDNTVVLTFFDDTGNDLGSKTFGIETLPLSDAMPLITIQEMKQDQMAPGMTLVSYFGHNGEPFPQSPLMFDAFGDIRWYLDFSLHPQLNRLFFDDGVERLANGNFYFGSGGAGFGGSGDNRIYEVDLFGNVVDSWDMPGYGFHHEVSEKPDGNFLVTVNKLGAATIEDYIIEIDRNTKQIVREWNLNESLDNTRRTLIADPVDWVHVNAVTYDPSDDTIIVSGRTQGVIKLAASNEVVWIMGPHKEWGTAGNGIDLNQFLLQPLNSDGQPILDVSVLDGDANHPDFEWNWYQHAPLIHPNGDILLFDNGDNRNFVGGTYSRAVQYRVNEQNMTIQQVWQYGKERDEETYSRIVSDVDYLAADDHILFSPGAVVRNGGRYGKSIEINFSTGTVIFEATITPPIAFFDIITLHRTERLPLYPDP